ncbi:MAG: class I SAM-dependent methyltransferase [Agriterribacter sp.]
MNFLKKILTKTIAQQLRKPSGLLAGKVGKEMNKSNGLLYDFTVDAMQIADNEAILEIGFGNGKFFDKIFSLANNLKISGLDFSPDMVKEATSNNPSTSSSGKLTLRLGSSDNIPFLDNSFDKVFCINVIYFWDKPADHLKEIHRVLKPGGKFYASVRTKETLTRLPFTEYGFNIYTQDEWINIMKANHLHFIDARKTDNEPDAVFDKQSIKMESLCIVAEKK